MSLPARAGKIFFSLMKCVGLRCVSCIGREGLHYEVSYTTQIHDEVTHHATVFRTNSEASALLRYHDYLDRMAADSFAEQLGLDS